MMYKRIFTADGTRNVSERVARRHKTHEKAQKRGERVVKGERKALAKVMRDALASV